MKKIILFLCSILIFSCMKELDIPIPDAEQQIVVDGWIESGKTANVILTLTSAYFSNVDSDVLRTLVITQAKVTISDSTTTEILTLGRNTVYFPSYVYRSSSIKGEVGKTYYLKVEYAGHVVTAKTTIPQPVKLDTVWFEPKKPNDTLGVIKAQFTDNAQTTDYYRILTKRKGIDKKYISSYYSTCRDVLFNGQKFTTPIYKGLGSLNDDYDNTFFQKGDTVDIEFCAIDREHYSFWNSFELEVINTGSPFASQNTNIKSNISGGLGIWGGYGASYKRIILK